MRGMLETSKVISFFELDPKQETQKMSKAEKYNWLLDNYDEALKTVLGWAQKKYPYTPHMYQLSFANQIIYFTTEFYGGYGTESVIKERMAEAKTYEFYKNLNSSSKTLSKEDMTLTIIFFIVSHILQKSPFEE